jgi:four helix bundle protein
MQSDDKDIPLDLKLRTRRYAIEIIRAYSALDKSVIAQTLGRQFLRSGTSVGANYREAVRARSNPEFISKIGDSLKELEETLYWLELCDESGILSRRQLALITAETNELLAIMTTIAKKVKKRG